MQSNKPDRPNRPNEQDRLAGRARRANRGGPGEFPSALSCSFQARPFPLQGWGLIDLPLRAAFSPAHPMARRDVPLALARASCFLLFTITPSRPGESPDYPSLSASNEHSFIVRVLRARRAPGRSLLILLKPHVTRAQWIRGQILRQA